MKERRPAVLLELALALPAVLFRVVANARGWLYDLGFLVEVDTQTPVISVGNLTTGGTGKTPITSFLTSQLTLRGYEVSIISRGYGGSERGPARVVASSITETSRKFGDEPAWLASRHSASTVVVGAKRPEAIAFLNQLRQTNVHSAMRHLVIADDAFQHRRLKRSLDVVILDATAPRWHYRALPLGRLREPFAALKRADFVFISKVNAAESTRLNWLRKKLEATAKLSNMNFTTYEFSMSLAGVVALNENQTQEAVPGSLSHFLKAPDSPTQFRQHRVALMSAIARPETFEELVRSSEGVQIVTHFQFSDHHIFSEAELQRAEREALALGAEAIVVTEKDAVKLALWRPKIPCYVTRLHATPLSDLGGFFEAVDRLT